MFKGKRPTDFEIRHAKTGEIDSLIRQLAAFEKATLVTADKVQSLVAESKGVRVILYEFEQEEKPFVLEKYFDKMKNNLDSRRLRVHSEESLEGRLFLIFISLIIYSYIGKVMRETELNKKYTIQEIIYELKKIKRIQLRNEMFIITEISKKQRDLFKCFKIKIPQT